MYTYRAAMTVFASFIFIFAASLAGCSTTTPTTKETRQKKHSDKPGQSPKKPEKIHNPSRDLVTDYTTSPPDDLGDHKLRGKASWYGSKFHRQQAADGEYYDMYGFTAAHKTLPFHTIVRVVEVSTRKSVVVRITDRGPYAEGRIIDLSYAAAKDLELVGKGVTEVRLEIVKWGDGTLLHNQTTKPPE